MQYKLTYEQYSNALLGGRLLGLRCEECGKITIPPKMACMSCQSTSLEIQQLSGEGEIQTFTVVRVVPEGFNPPLIVALVKLKEGPFVMGNLESADPDMATMQNLMGKEVIVGCKTFCGDRYSGGARMALTFKLDHH